MTLPAAFRDQAGHCAALGSPFMARLMTLLADRWPPDGPVAARCAAFDGDVGPTGHSVPLRLAGALHALVLSGRAPALAALYPPNAAPDDALSDAILTAFSDHAQRIVRWLDHAPQTNEIRRAACFIAGAQVAAARMDRPMVVSELGASAGLNLHWDRYALDLGAARFGPGDAAVIFRPDWSGPLPPLAAPSVAERRGVDLNPLDLKDPDDLVRALAYLWPDQPERLAMTRQAARLPAARVDRADAIDWLDTRLASVRPGHLHLVQNSIAWQYFPTDAQRRGRALIEEAGQRATHDSPLGWLQMEADGAGPGAALTLRLWPGDLDLALGRADFHGRWIAWHAA